MARTDSKSRNVLIDLLDSLIDLGMKLGGVVFLVVLGYLIYGLVNKSGFGNLGELSQADRARIIEVVRLACQILWVSGTVTAFSVAIRYYAEESLGYILSILGIVFYFGTPYLFSMQFVQADFSQNQAVDLIVHDVRLLGMVIFVPGTALILRDMVVRLLSAVTDRKKKGANARSGAFLVGKQIEEAEQQQCKPRAYSKCWQMSYCRQFVRNMCPVYQAGKSCWQMKQGCMCDGDIIVKALKSTNSEAKKMRRDLAYRTVDISQRTRTLSAAQKRERCRQCVIYEFHQMQKYRLVSPLVFPIVIGFIWIMHPRITEMFKTVIKVTDEFMKTVSFLPHSEATSKVDASTPDVVLVVFTVWLAIVAVSYALRLVEFCIFKLQI